MNSGGLLTLRDARAYGAAVSFLQDFARLMDRLIAAQTRLLSFAKKKPATPAPELAAELA